MSHEPEHEESVVTAAAKKFWRTRQFWMLMLGIIVGCLIIGYLIGNWAAASQAKSLLKEQEQAYNEASDARKVILAQCLRNNDKLTSRLAELGDKTATALDKLSTERKIE